MSGFFIFTYMLKKDPLQIIAFQSYGTNSHFKIHGRALEDEAINLEDKSLWSLIVNTWKRFETDEVKRVGLDIKLPNGRIFSTITDNHGYFKIEEKDGVLTFQMVEVSLSTRFVC